MTISTPSGNVPASKCVLKEIDNDTKIILWCRCVGWKSENPNSSGLARVEILSSEDCICANKHVNGTFHHYGLMTPAIPIK